MGNVRKITDTTAGWALTFVMGDASLEMFGSLADVIVPFLDGFRFPGSRFALEQGSLRTVEVRFLRRPEGRITEKSQHVNSVLPEMIDGAVG